jgi:hypothetical protein
MGNLNKCAQQIPAKAKRTINVSFVEELIPLARLRWLQLVVLTALLVVVGAVSLQLKFSVLDLDVWWHLKTGDWIVQHDAFPRTGILSRSAANHSWAAYSWGYEVVLSRFYAWFGLIGIGLYGTLLTLMVGFSIYWMVRRLSGRFWVACLLAAVCCYAFLFLMMPRPVFFSITLLCVTLTLLLESQRSGNVRKLYWMPLVFLLWANLHIQFIYGLAIWGLFVAINLLQRLTERIGYAPACLAESKLPVGPLTALFGASILATMIGPYSYHLYGVIFAYSRSQLIYSMITELQPLSFRAYENFVELLLAGVAFFVVARQNRVNLFKIVLLTMASIMGFRTMRDSWLLCVSAAGCIADTMRETGERETGDTLLELAGVFAVVALVLAVLAPGLEFNTRGLDRAITSRFPVNAVNFVRQNHVPGPLFNNFDWGGFLTWYLPEYPVSIDGRTDLYGDELDQKLLTTLNGNPSYKTDPYLNDAGLVLLRRREGLSSALEIDPHFRKIYEDQMAVAFVRQ